MKKLIALFLFGFFALQCAAQSTKKLAEPVSEKPRNGVAVIMTGAAARIPQEAALLEELDRRGLLKNLVFISGVSSGALNAVALNGIKSGKMTWTEYKNILYNLKNSDVFLMDKKRIPVDTEPAQKLYKKIFEQRLGYYQIGDLPIMTGISITHLSSLGLKKTIYRMCSQKINEETDTSLSLVDVAMASTAFPVFFPAVRIKNVKTIPDVEYVDGGFGDDQIPFYALLEFEKFRGIGVERVYIISRKSDSVPKISEELQGIGIDDNGFFNKLGISLDAYLKKGFMKGLEVYATEAPELIPRTQVWIPEFKEDFLLFNFENLKEQYTITSQWARTHNPIRLGDFLLPYILKKD